MNGGYDPEAMWQQYKDWESKAWQPPTWGQLPGIQATGIPGAQTMQIPPQAPEGPVWLPSWEDWAKQPPELAAKAWKSAAYSPWEAMGEQARHLIGKGREAIEAFREAPSWQAGAEFLGSSMDVLGEFPTVPWAGAKRGLLKLKEIATGSVGKQFFQDLLQSGPLTEEAKDFFDKELDIGITEPYGPGTVGGYYETHRQPPSQPSLAYLLTANKPTAIHELSHAWWEVRHQEERDAFIEAMIQYADESKQYQFKSPAMERAILSVYGLSDYPYHSRGARIPGKGQLPIFDPATGQTTTPPITEETQWNDHEMYAYMAETVMGDISKLPPYLRRFYEGLFIPEAHQDTWTEYGFGPSPTSPFNWPTPTRRQP